MENKKQTKYAEKLFKDIHSNDICTFKSGGKIYKNAVINYLRKDENTVFFVLEEDKLKFFKISDITYVKKTGEKIKEVEEVSTYEKFRRLINRNTNLYISK
jgi:hypothetical protein